MDKAVVLTFGRFQGPSVGHLKLINKVASVAQENHAVARVYTSHSQDSSKNPIPYSTKVRLLSQIFPQVKIINSPDVNLFTIIPHLSQEGFKKVILVVGSDRVSEFKRTLTPYIKSVKDPKFDPSKNFDIKLEVVSAGERDDGPGISGASGTKMREYVRKNDFESFYKNSATKNRSLAKQVFDAMKSGLKESLNEGIHDPSIFKAVFLCGSPGSGKDTILKQCVSGNGLVELNRDHAFEMMMKNSNLSLMMPDSEADERNMIRTRSKSVNVDRTRLAISGRLGIIINGTADDETKINTIKARLEALGYDTMMIFVNTSDDISKERNIMRGKLGGRMVPEPVRSEKWNASQRAAKQYRSIFGDNFIELDNSRDIFNGSDEEKRQATDDMNKVFKKVRAFCSRPIGRTASAWITRQKQKSGITEGRKLQSFSVFRQRSQKIQIEE